MFQKASSALVCERAKHSLGKFGYWSYISMLDFLLNLFSPILFKKKKMLFSKENQKFTCYPDMLHCIHDTPVGFSILEVFVFLLYKY